MRDWPSRMRTACLTLVLLFLAPCAALAVGAPCPRPAQGSVIEPAADLYSQHGALKVTLNYYTTVDQWGRTLFCYTTSAGQEAPTLHLNPGDWLDLTLANDEITDNSTGQDKPGDTLSLLSLGSGVETVAGTAHACMGTTMTVASANLHFHGLNVTPQCHGDQVIYTIVNPGQSFQYHFQIPTDEPPGMYWYHAHIHGIASPAVQGGASGAIEVEGIANYQPAVQGLPQRFLTIRDQPLQNPPPKGPDTTEVPFWDVSLNYVPVPYPNYPPGIIQMQAGAKEFWRVVNAAADTNMDLQVVYDGVAQPLQVVARDGVPIGSQDGARQGYLITQHDVYIPPAGRAEFIVTGPSASVKNAVFLTEHIDTGPGGDEDTQRPLAQIQLTNDSTKIPKPIKATNAPLHRQRFEDVTDQMVTAHRSLYFDEHISADKKDPTGGFLFFITVKGEFDKVYEPYNPPSIITHKGAIEDWTIENHTNEVHEFHMHQIHYKLLAVNGKPVPPKDQQWYDTYQVPYWSGTGPFPRIKVRMDFRGAVEGEFVYHCHILDHEDRGMMANILVLPPNQPPPRHARAGSPAHQASVMHAGSANTGGPAHA